MPSSSSYAFNYIRSLLRLLFLEVGCYILCFLRERVDLEYIR